MNYDVGIQGCFMGANPAEDTTNLSVHFHPLSIPRVFSIIEPSDEVLIAGAFELELLEGWVKDGDEEISGLKVIRGIKSIGDKDHLDSFGVAGRLAQQGHLGLSKELLPSGCTIHSNNRPSGHYVWLYSDRWNTDRTNL
jgi:hypothetical protein